MGNDISGQDIRPAFNACVRGAAFTPGQWANNFTTGLATWWNPQDGSIYKHEHPRLPEGVTPDILAAKAERVLNPNATARAFTEAMVNQPKVLSAPDARGNVSTYSQVMTVDDKETGFSGAIYMNEKGHAIVFYPGMNGRSDPTSIPADVVSYWQSEQGLVNNQAGQAQDLYVTAASMAKSVETVGMSLGTVHTNMLAGKYGAKATNLSDIGLPSVYMTDESVRNIRSNVISMRVEGDTPPKFPVLNVGGYKDGFLYAGKVYGQEQVLPRPQDEQILKAVHDITPQHDQYVDKRYPCEGGLEHLPQAYMVAQENNAAAKESPVLASGMKATPVSLTN